MTEGLLKHREVHATVFFFWSGVDCFLPLGQCSSFTSRSLITYHSADIELVGRKGLLKHGPTKSVVLFVHFPGPVAHHGGAVFGLGGLYVLGHRQVDELVLGLCLHHPGALLSHHLDVFRDVKITVQT